MQKHVKIYMNHFGYTIADRFGCENCGSFNGGEIHHIECRGMGGSDTKDFIENLMYLCRSCHEEYGDKKQYKRYLKNIHGRKLGVNIK